MKSPKRASAYDVIERARKLVKEGVATSTTLAEAVDVSPRSMRYMLDPNYKNVSLDAVDRLAVVCDRLER